MNDRNTSPGPGAIGSRASQIADVVYRASICIIDS
jgi:hypothetical protein